MDARTEGLKAIADEIGGHTKPPIMDLKSNGERTAKLVGETMAKACEAAAMEVEALGQAAQDAAREIVESTTELANLIRKRGEITRQNIEHLVMTMRDISEEVEQRREKINDFTAGIHRALLPENKLS